MSGLQLLTAETKSSQAPVILVSIWRSLITTTLTGALCDIAPVSPAVHR